MESSDTAMRKDLMAIWGLQREINRQAQGATPATAAESAEGLVQRLLDEAQRFITRYNPQGYSLSVGADSGFSISFTWESRPKPVPRYLAEV